MDEILELLAEEAENKPDRRFGKWFIQPIKNDRKIIELGIGENCADGCYGPFQVRTKYFLCFYKAVSRPTMDYLNFADKTGHELSKNDRLR